MGIEYKIRFKYPTDYNFSAMLRILPSPIDRPRMIEIYNYRIDADGFYFIDHLVNRMLWHWLSNNLLITHLRFQQRLR
jgi:hypothetical protein